MTLVALAGGRRVTLSADDDTITTTADPVNPEEAIAWFFHKTAIPKERWLELDERVRRRTFTAAGVVSMAVLTDTMAAMDRAIAEGRTLEQFREDVLPGLQSQWGGEIPGRIETIFRNGAQSAYATGRYQQATDPEILEDRPYWQFAAIMDSRTTDICRPLDELVRRNTDEFWKSHYPPLHHNCRSTVVTLDEDEAHEAGGVTAPPTEGGVPQAGWGRTPDQSEWEPKQADYPPDVWKLYQEQHRGDAWEAETPSMMSLPTTGTRSHPGDLLTAEEAHRTIANANEQYGLTEFVERTNTLVVIASDGEMLKYPSQGVIQTAFAMFHPAWSETGSHRPIIEMSRLAPSRSGEYEYGKPLGVDEGAASAVESYARVYVHEVGHLFHAELLPYEEDRLAEIYRERIRSGRLPSRYAREDFREFVAEAFAASILEPDALHAADAELELVINAARKRRGIGVS